MQRGVEVAAGITGAATLHGVHAHRHGTILVRRNTVRRMRKPAFRLDTFTGASNELTANLECIGQGRVIWEHTFRLVWLVDGGDLCSRGNRHFEEIKEMESIGKGLLFRAVLLRKRFQMSSSCLLSTHCKIQCNVDQL